MRESGAAKPGRDKTKSAEGQPAAAVQRDASVLPADAQRERTVFEAELMQQLDSLYGFAFKLTRARDDAEDLVSETVVRALDKWRQYAPGTNMRAWLFTILYHTFVSRKRRIDKREVHPADDRDGWSAFDVVGDSDPEGAFYDSFVDDEITRAIDALPDEYREAVLLSDLHELRYAEIAEILGVPEGTVKSRLFRARRILQKKLVDYAVEMGYIQRR